MNKKVLIPVIALAVVAAGVLVYTKVIPKSEGGSDDHLLIPAAAADIHEDSNRLEVQEGSVTIRHTSGQEDTVTDEADVVVGDTIIVSADGKATLYWFDHSISRLAAGTEITIDQAAYNPENINETDISFEVVGGEVWSKVQAIVEEDSEFLGYAGNVVAGVRGSVFNMAVEGDEVVVDSIAHALWVGGESLTSGEEGQFKKESGEFLAKHSISLDDWERPWFRDNLDRDRADQERMMAAMMNRLRLSIGALPGEPEFTEKIEKLDAFMRSDADQGKKERVKAKIVALVRAMDVLPDNKLFPIQVMLQEKLLEWEKDNAKREYLMRKRFEKRLYILNDWLRHNDPNPAELKRYLDGFRDMASSAPGFFEENPELTGLVSNTLDLLVKKRPELKEEAEFLRIVDRINALNEESILFDRTAPIREADPNTVKLLNIKALDPPITTEPRDVIENEAPFYQGESNV